MLSLIVVMLIVCVLESELVQDLLFCGGYSADSSAETNNNDNNTSTESTNPRYDRVCLFVRIVGEPYAYFGRVSIDEVNLTVHPIQITWNLKDSDNLQKIEHFQNILKISSS